MASDWIHRLYLDGSAKWPQVALSFEHFARHVESLPVPLSSEPTSRDGAGLFLCCACATRDPEALRIFQAEVLDTARSATSKVLREREFVAETIQELWQKLLFDEHPKVAIFAGRGPLNAWVRSVATRLALDRCRALGVQASRQGELTDSFVAPQLSPELALSRQRYQAAFESAWAEAIAGLSARSRVVLSMYVCDHASIDEIAQVYQVHRSTAARWIERTRRDLHRTLRTALEARGVRLSDSELKSLALWMASQLEPQLSS